MTRIRKLALELCLVLQFIGYSGLTNSQELIPGQIYSTGNIVIPTNSGGPSSWTNGVYQDSLTCWGWGNPGYCGPNAIVRPGNNINFSYGLTDLYQAHAVTNLLPNSGTGLRVDGYNFSFTAKNGNGWDDGRTDTLSAYVYFTNKNNQIVENRNYNLNYSFNWTNFNFTETFNTPYRASDLNSVRYGFVGKDNNFWAGPYGPEINNVSFSLRYSVDTCSINILSSPTCPGYNDAVNKLTVQPVSIQQNTSFQEPIQSAPITYSITASNSTSNSIQQPKTADAQATANQNIAPKASLNQVLSILRTEQSRVSRLETFTATSAVEQAKLDASKSENEALAVATYAQTSNIVNNENTVTSLNQGQALGTGLQVNNLSILNTTSTQLNSSQTNTFSFQTSSLSRIDQEDKQQSYENNNPAQLFNATNILNSAITPPINLTQPVQPQPGSSVNRNVQPNQAAEGKDINSLAVTPLGFDAYTQLALRDGAFYKPFEVYRGQVNVDNVRAMRQLSSDRLHQQMIDQQYKQ